MLSSIKDVAIRAGVSTATVSHVINGTRYVADDTMKKVHKAMNELDYTPNSVARSLRSRKSKIIGLLVPIHASDTSNFFFMSIANGIESVLKNNGYNLIVSNSNENRETEKEQIKVLNTQQIDGLIMAPTAEGQEDLHSILTKNYPVVFIDRKPNKYEGDYVLVDGVQGTYEATELLVKKGHHNIGYITGSLGITTSDERLEGFNKALQDHQIELQASFVKEGDSSFESGYDLAKELVELQKVTAILVSNNVMTMGAIQYLQKNLVKIPDQIALIGFDDYMWAEITSPPLSVIKQPSYELGEIAAQTLLRRLENPTKAFEEIRLPTELIIRNSC